MDISLVLFTDETRATNDGRDGWSNGWVHFRGRGKWLGAFQGNSRMEESWYGQVSSEVYFLGLSKCPKEIKVTSASYCDLLQKVFGALVRWHICFATMGICVFAWQPTLFMPILHLGIQGEKLITWPPYSRNLNLIENHWSIAK